MTEVIFITAVLFIPWRLNNVFFWCKFYYLNNNSSIKRVLLFTSELFFYYYYAFIYFFHLFYFIYAIRINYNIGEFWNSCTLINRSQRNIFKTELVVCCKYLMVLIIRILLPVFSEGGYSFIVAQTWLAKQLMFTSFLYENIKTDPLSWKLNHFNGTWQELL